MNKGGLSQLIFLEMFIYQEILKAQRTFHHQVFKIHLEAVELLIVVMLLLSSSILRVIGFGQLITVEKMMKKD